MTYYIGLMSGTSMDAVDTALVRITDTDSVEMIAYEQFPIEAALKQAVRNLNADSSLNDITHYDAMLGHLFANAVTTLLRQNAIPASDVTAIGSHGQTVLHLPDAKYPRTLQIGDPNIIAHKTSITTVADFRRRDMATGGQGAPLAPAFHNAMFRSKEADRLILNLGGIANVTALPKDTSANILGFDTGPGNGLLDDWNRKHNNTDMDMNSAWAATGQVDDQLLNTMLADPFLSLPPPKSTGRDYFNMDWVSNMLLSVGARISPASVQATLLELTTRTITDAIQQYAPATEELYLCGGGTHNSRMATRLKELMPDITIDDTGALGVSPDAVEAVCFAWLARETLANRPCDLGHITGATEPTLLGGIYPGKTL